jgi:hypothetical protein
LLTIHPGGQDCPINLPKSRQVSVAHQLLARKIDGDLLFRNEAVNGHGNGDEKSGTEDDQLQAGWEVLEHALL